MLEITNEKFVESKLIPLKKYSKIASKKWGINDEIKFDGDETGYAIDTGRSNLVVIDCDVKNDGVDGLSNFIEYYIEKSGGDVPETFTVETPSGGRHFYYKTDSFYKSSNGSLLKGVDIRANGGYIVGPGSKIKYPGRDEILEYTVENERDIKFLPEWLSDEIKNISTKGEVEITKDSKLTHNKKNNEQNSSSNSESEEIEKKNALNWATDKMLTANEGERNDILNSLAYFMGRKRVDRILAENLVEYAIKAGLEKSEANKTFDSGYAKGLTEEELPFISITKNFNILNKISFKNDPLDSEFYGQTSLAYNFYNKYSERLLFYNESSEWYEYDSSIGVWFKTTEEILRSLLREYLENLVTEIRAEKVNRLPSNIYKLQEKLWSRATIDAVLILARSDFLNKEKNLFDSCKYLINCKNGVVNLKTGDISPHSKTYYMTKHIPINYFPDSSDKYGKMVIESIAEEQREFMQLLAGQSLTGYQPNSQITLLLHGRGSNGKSTFIDLALKTSGDYGRLQTPDILLPTNGKENYALADFDGLRTAIIEELPDSKQLNTGALKRLVGTDKLNARAIYGKNREFVNQATLFISCNKLPLVNETDHGTWRRLLVIDFPYVYKKIIKESNNKFERKADPMVMYSARNRISTAEYFLKWRVEGAIRWFSDINSENNVPKEILDNVEEWQENNDLILKWANKYLVPKANSVILLQDAFDSFNYVAEQNGQSVFSLRYFTPTFTNHSFYFDNKLSYESHKRILKKYSISHWNDPKDKNKIPRAGTGMESYFVNVAFKDDDEEIV